MCDDGRGNGVDQLSARIIPQQQSGQLVIFDQRNGVAVLSILHRNADAISEELANIDRIMSHLNGGDQTFRGNERAGRLELPRGEPIAHHRVRRNIEWRDAVQKILLGWLE